MQSDDGLIHPSERSEPIETPPASNPPSRWSKAKGKLGSISEQAAKVAAFGTAGAAKTAGLGKQTIGTASDLAKNALDSGRQVYADSKLAEVVDYLDGEFEQRGGKQKLRDTTGAVIGKLDQVTGKRLVELLEQKLRLQDEYNDVLATRLAEALERIAALEVRIHGH